MLSALVSVIFHPQGRILRS